MLGDGAAETPGVESVRLGVLGCGRQAQRGHVPAAGRAAGVALAAVADTHPDRCATAAPGVAGFSSLAELLGAGVDAVVIATPTDEHLAAARLVAEAGLPALVEKPPGPDLRSAAELCSLPTPVWIGFNRRFDPALEALRDGLAGESGLQLRLGLQFPYWLWRPHVRHDDALLDLGTHLVDLARWLLSGEVRRVRAAALRPTRASLELDLGLSRARIECSSNRFWSEAVDVAGRGRAPRRHRRGGLLDSALRRLRLRRRDDGFLTSLAGQLEALAAAVRGDGEGRLATASDGAVALAAVEAARDSAAAGGEWRSLRPGVPSAT